MMYLDLTDELSFLFVVYFWFALNLDKIRAHMVDGLGAIYEQQFKRYGEWLIHCIFGLNLHVYMGNTGVIYFVRKAIFHYFYWATDVNEEDFL